MHLHMMHTSSYYTAVSSTAAATNTTNSTVPCLNVTTTSRVMSGIQKCACAMSTSNSSTASTSSTAFNASTAAPTHHFNTLHARNAPAETGMNKGVIIAIVVICSIFLLAAFVCAICAGRSPNNKHAHAHGPDCATSHNCSKNHAIAMQNYRSRAGLATPPRAHGHGGRATAPQFPGPRNGFGAQSTRETRNASGPYGNASPYGGTGPTMGGRGTYC
jgi:hypothetical protein